MDTKNIEKDRITVYLKKTIIEKLRLIYASGGGSLSGQIEKALKAYFKTQKDVLSRYNTKVNGD